MLDRALSIYLRSGTSRTTPRLSFYIKSLQAQMDGIMLRIPGPNSSSLSSGLVLLSYLIGTADWLQLDSMKSDTDRYMSCLSKDIDTLERWIDPSYQNGTSGGFIRTSPGSKSVEILVPVRCEDYLSGLPMEKGWEEWAKVRPLRILDMDTDELSMHVYLDKLTFVKQPPRVAILSIDIVALILQYAKYKDVTPEKMRISLVDYLHTYVVVPRLLEDGVNLWLRNNYANILDTVMEADYRTRIPEQTHGIYGRPGASYVQGMIEIAELAYQASFGTVAPQVLLASIPMLTQSMPEYYEALRKSTQVANLQQSRWIEYLRDSTWIDMVFFAARLQPANMFYKQLVVAMRRDIPLLYNTKPWSSIHNSVLRHYVEASMQRKLSILTSIP